MRTYLEARRKAIAPALAQLAGAGVLWALTGKIDAPEIVLGVSALVTALIVEKTRNGPKRPVPRSEKGEPR